MNKKVFLITSALLLWVITMSAQTYDLPNYIVYKKGYISLKNGDILKGKYVYSVDFKKLKVIANNETRIFDADDVARITKKNPFELADTSNGFIPSTYKPSRIFNITELGFLIGNQDNTNKSPFIFHTSANYSFTPLLSAGVGTGVELYRETYVPVTVHVMYKLNNRRTSSYVSLSGGYQIPVDGTRMTTTELYSPLMSDYMYSSSYYPYPYYQNSELKAKGGFLLHPAMGFFYQLNEGLGMGVSVGYRFQVLNYTGDNDYRLDVTYNRLSVKLGFIFN